ncbi:MAG: DNRLRE domain-containing protein [Gaiellaceae bacterium]
MNFRDGSGRWQPIDSSLVARAGGGFTQRANDFEVLLPASLAAPVRVGRGAVWASLQLRGAAGQASVSGVTARYAEALPGVDVAYSATAEGVKEALVLQSAAAPSSFVFTLRTSAGLQPRLAARGGAVELVDGSGQVVLRLASPFMVDSAGGRESVSRALSVALSPVAGGHLLTVSADRAWLAAPERRFPVVIDPTMSFFSTGYLEGYWADCTLSSQAPELSSCDLNTVEAGNDAGARKRTVLQWDVSDLTTGRSGGPVEVMSAELRLYADQITGSGTLNLHRLTRSYANGVSWNRYDGTNAWTSGGGDFAAASEAATTTGAAGRWYSWFPTTLVKGWVEGTIANQGMLLKTETEAAGFNARFRSADYAGTEFDPVLRVNYRPQLGMQRQYHFETEKLSDRLDLHVNPGNGNLVVAAEELNLNGTGIDLQISRYFNGLAPFTRSSGHGWSLGTGHDVFLKEATDGTVTLTGPSFYGVVFQTAPNYTYISPTGIDANLKKIVSFFGNSFKLTFNQSGEVWTFNAAGVLTSQADRNGNKLTFAYSSGKVSTITDSQARVVTFAYNSNGRLQSITDPSSRQWQYGYDTGGYLTSSTDPANKQTLYLYDSAGRLIRITDPLGNQTRIAYDLDRRVTSVTRVTDTTAGTGPTTTFEYGTPTIVRDPRGNPESFTFDSELRVTQVVDANGNSSNTGFTSNSDVSSYAPAGAGTWNYQYDPNNNLTQQDSPTGAQAKFEYTNTIDRYLLTKAIDAQGNATTYDYDAKGNLTRLTNAAASQNQSTYTYNTNGTIATATDFKGNVTGYGYDSKGNLTSADRPAPLGDITLTYDTLSRIATVRDGKAQLTTYTYDLLDRITQIQYQDGSLISYSYDANGNQLTMADNTGTSSYTYDQLNRILTESLPGQQQVSYLYDAASNLISYTDAGGTIGYAYNNLNMLATLTEPGPKQTTFVYDTAHRRTQTNYPNGVSMFFSYDLSNRQTRVLGQKPASGLVLSDFTYSWVNASLQDTGLRQHVTDKNGIRTTYSYDVLNRLTLATAPSESYAYSYDANSNRASQTVNGVTTNYTHNAADQLTAAGSVTYSYDANGNETSTTAGRQWSYNPKDQATSVTPPGGSPIPMSYTGTGQFERVSAGATTFMTSGLGLSRENTTHYTRDDDRQLISQRTPSGNYYYLLDGVGSVAALTDTAGNTAATYSYEPFGKLKSSTGTVTNPYRWLGGLGVYHDTATGLYKMGTRNYDVALGRFGQVDPVAGGAANSYDYAAQDPINKVDTDGMKVTPGAGIGGGWVSAGGAGGRPCRPKKDCVQFWKNLFFIKDVILCAWGIRKNANPGACQRFGIG